VDDYALVLGSSMPTSTHVLTYIKDMLKIHDAIKLLDSSPLKLYVAFLYMEKEYSDRSVHNYAETIHYMNPFDQHLASWKMDKLVTINRLRYDNTMVYNGGEALIVSQNKGINYITQIDKHYMLGNAKLYKSNKFDIYYDDSQVSRIREDAVKTFITDNVKRFAPGFMEIRDIKPLNNIIVESDSTVGENNG
jgi:hypothetical protein